MLLLNGTTIVFFRVGRCISLGCNALGFLSFSQLQKAEALRVEESIPFMPTISAESRKLSGARQAGEQPNGIEQKATSFTILFEDAAARRQKLEQV